MSIDEQNQLKDLAIAVAVTNEKLSNIEYLLKQHIEKDEGSFADHEKRIRTNEKRHWYSGGVAAVLTVIGTIFARDFFGGG